jgi:hypothetical protein
MIPLVNASQSGAYPADALIPLHALSAYLRRELKAGRTPEWVKVDDGEHRLCRSCLRAGYGVDSWHRATAEDWVTIRGRLRFNKCKACCSEVQARKFGFVPEGVAA